MRGRIHRYEEAAMLLDIWEASWRVPNSPLFIVGLIIVGWGMASGFLAFTGGSQSGQPEIKFPQQAPEMVEEPETAEETTE